MSTSIKPEKKRVLVVAAHPDDETLGCGGTILKHICAGDAVDWLIMTNVSQEQGFDRGFVARRQRQIRQVAKAYGFRQVHMLDLPTTRLDCVARGELVKCVSGVVQKIRPDILYVPFINDVHSDHEITLKAVLSATKSFRLLSLRQVLAYEALSETEFALPIRQKVFVPTAFSDISRFMEKKLKIMRIYKEELKKAPFPRSLKNMRALACFRGSTAGVDYAEAFMILKEIV
ncbi:MAG TPA: PIG-L family deacetylase [Candidatus Omnitrophota bacterium]|nr:PIG-L family deacetylase [Candidatus Omnitrophota bacterium]HRZ15542.1 PIG-L family deacetylase [Candidatus Omnitrophota bacterium]